MKRIVILLLIVSMAACKKGSKAPAPTAASPLLPIKDQTCTTGTIISATQSAITFTWSAGQNADSYDLSIKNLLTSTETTQNVTGTQATVTLLRNTPYSWYLTSKSQNNATTVKSDVWKFYNAGAGVITYAPFPAELVSPTIGQNVTATAGTINLSWKGSIVTGGASITGYNVYFGPKTNPDLYKSSVTDMFINNISVSSNTTYYWHVVTIDANYNVSDSGVNTFFVK